MIDLLIEQRRITLPKRRQGLATGTASRAALAPIFARATASSWEKSEAAISIQEVTLERMIVRYSEQVAFQPLRELRHFFTYAGGAYIEPGYPPLYYAKKPTKKISPNKSAVCAIGEGVAGFLAQRLFRCRRLARPNHDYPDIVMESGDAIYLVESKATIAGNVVAKLQMEFPRLAAMTVSAKQMDDRPIVGLLVGTTLTSERTFECALLRIDLA